VSDNVRVRGRRIEQLRTELLLRNVAQLDVRELLGHRIAFVRVPDWLLASPLIHQLPKHGCVVTIVSSANPDLDGDALAAQARGLRDAGYALALDGEWGESVFASLAPNASYIIVNAALRLPPDLRRHIAATAGRFPAVTIIGRTINSFDDFELCRTAGCGLFQGAFVVSGEDWAGNRVAPNALRTIKLLNQIRQDSPAAELVEALKHDPVLPYRLLRYVNSAAFAMKVKVSSIEDALLVLGREQLYRWVALVLFSSIGGRAGSIAILEHALVRGRLMELLGRDTLPAEHHDRLFMTGLFSLLDRFLCVPLATAVNQLVLPDEVAHALLANQGPYASYLAIAVTCEGTDGTRLKSLLRAIGVDPDTANALHVQALLWAQDGLDH
jgi:EAL and modified HD-GYP domain-containing signal transduction protein